MRWFYCRLVDVYYISYSDKGNMLPNMIFKSCFR